MYCLYCRYMVQVADVEASTDTDSALTPAPAYLEGQPGVIDCINVSCGCLPKHTANTDVAGITHVADVDACCGCLHAAVGLHALQPNALLYD
jgi:hypothetical protein